MSPVRQRNLKPIGQYSIGLLLVLMVSMGCYFFTGVIGYQVVALLLLLTVSVNAMLFDILPVLTTAVASALIWNYFFIPPVFTFHIDRAADLLTFLMYFAIALINAVLTYKIRVAEKKAREQEERERTIRLYDTLISSLSHELRTPVATILGAVDALSDAQGKLTGGQRDELLHQIDAAGMRLNRQIGNLLNMSRLESGVLKLKKDWCDLNEQLFSIIAEISPLNSGHRIEFTPDEQLPLFRLDAGLIEQVLKNILYNAVQYTPEGSTIWINAGYASEQCVIRIEDNGPGFPQEEAPFLFDKFYRVPHSKAGGSGLGLSIAKGFVEAHGGDIVATNRPTGGARFQITIPVETTFINNLKHE